MVSDKEYGRYIKTMLSDSRISQANLEVLKKYDSQGIIQQVTIGTRSVRLNTLRQLALFVNKNFKAMKKNDIENYFSSLGELQSKTWSSKGAFIKSFFKWLYNSDEYPANVKWIKTSVKNKNHKLPSDLLTKEEIKAMINAGDSLQEKALISVLYESASRIGELLNLKLKDAVPDQYGCVIMVDGKTGMRRIRLIESSPDIVLWINNHPKKEDRDSPLFIHLHNHDTSYCKGMDWSTAKMIINRLAKKAGITKRIHPHLFRHSRLTELAKDFTESELKIMAGWTGSSNMAGVYVHLSGADIEKKILEKNGLKDHINNAGKETLKPRECPRCKGTNPNTARYCYTCGMVLDTKAALEIEPGANIEVIPKKPQTDDVLSKGLIQFIVKNHPELVLEFLKENGMDRLI